MIASVFIVLIIILLYILFTPIAFEASNESQGEQRAVVRIKIFPFGFINLSGGVKNEKNKGEVKPTKKTGKASKKSGLFSYLFSDLELVKQIAFEMIRFCYGIIRCPYKYYFRLSLTGGLNQPHLTGQLYGAICAIGPILPESIKLSYEPDFIEDSVVASYNIGLKFILAALVYELFRLLFRLPFIKIIKMIWEYRKENQYAYQN